MPHDDSYGTYIDPYVTCDDVYGVMTVTSEATPKAATAKAAMAKAATHEATPKAATPEATPKAMPKVATPKAMPKAMLSATPEAVPPSPPPSDRLVIPDGGANTRSRPRLNPNRRAERRAAHDGAPST